jgi:DNA-binding NarL/FixJ family response regulator
MEGTVSMITRDAAKTRATATAKRQVLIVDDHPVVRQGIRAVIDKAEDLVVTGEADSVYDALRLIGQLQPDVVVTDISLGGDSGLDLIKDIRIRHGDLPVLALSVHDEGIYAERVLRAGANGYLTKAEGPQCVLRALRTVLAGEIFLSDAMSRRMLSKMTGRKNSGDGLSVDRLTDRELQVFELIGKGLNTRQTAEALHLSVKTVESHRANIKEKLQIGSATELLQQAIHWVQSQS